MTDVEEPQPEFVLSPEQEALEDKMYHLMKESPEWDVLPKPARWFKKYNIPPVKAQNLSEYLKSDYHNKVKLIPRNLPPLIIKEPQRGGIMVPLQKVEDEVTFTLYEKPFTGDLTFSPPEASEEQKHLVSQEEVVEGSSGDHDHALPALPELVESVEES
jgi:hypothetical protein